MCVLLLKDSQLYNYSNTVVDAFLPIMDSGMKWLEVIDPDKNEWHATNGGNQMILFKCTYYIVQHC